MFKTIGNAFKIPELRKKMLYTLFIIMIFRIGARIPVPFLNPEMLKSGTENATGALEFLNMFSGGAFNYGAIFAMGITPYINSSIIMQLLAVAIPALERLQQEGEEGRKKIGQITRYLTVGLGLLQGTAYYFYLKNSRMVQTYYSAANKVDMPSTIFVAVVMIAAFTAGSALVMWLGEQINQKGIGNGISIILFAGIISRIPELATRLYVFAFGIEGLKKVDTKIMQRNLPIAIGVIIIFLVVIAFIVFMTNAERRIKIQYAKRVVGRKMYGGQSTHMPIRVNIAGVLPIIFASTILSIPATILGFTHRTSGKLYNVLHIFDNGQPVHTILYLLFIIGFSYFYIGIQYNPIEMANNLRKNSGSIPGIRPGKPTSDYITGILSRVTFIGAIFLAIIAFLPIMIGFMDSQLRSLSIGGTSILILVGVALETFEAIESQMLMRHYKGFLD